MQFRMEQATEVLAQTPAVMRTLLEGKSAAWLHARRSADAFSAMDVLGHLMHGELTDWIPRARMIVARRGQEPFEPFDRFGFQELIAGRTLDEVLTHFAQLRSESLEALRTMSIGPEELEWPGLHPELGAVTMRNLLASWVVHDLAHIAQVVKTMACEYRDEVGPWRAYTSILS